MKNVQSARMQLLKGEAKAAARPGMNALPALTEVQISEATTESARITSMALANVSANQSEMAILQSEKVALQEMVKSEKIEYEEIKVTLAEETNKWFIDNVKPEYIPPYRPGTAVKEIKLTKKTTFVRVYDKMPGGSGMYGSWLMKVEDIEELTPLEIKDKFSLPTVPMYRCDVELDAGIHLREGEVNPVDGWGKGGGIQYDLIGQRVGEFKNERLLEDK